MKRIVKYIAIFAILTLPILYRNFGSEAYRTVSGQTMGTFYTIKVRTDKDIALLSDEVKNELAIINKQMSVFDRESEISKINQAKAGVWIDLSAEMSVVLKEAYHVYKLSNGAFDPTVGRLISLWGFGPDSEKKVPSDELVKKTLAVSGFDKITFAEDFSRLKKENNEVALNLSAIAKGYGVDQVAKVVHAAGFTDAIVEIGGEVYAKGNRADNTTGWNVGIINPNNDKPLVINLKNQATATSGNYRNFFDRNGKRYAHTISPKTGYPIESDLVSVTIFADTCMEADAMATALMAMETHSPYDFVKEHNIKAILFMRNDNGSTVITSPAARKYLDESKNN